MNLMLLAMFVAVGVGMFANDFERRELMVCAAIAAGLTLLYLLRPYYIT